MAHHDRPPEIDSKAASEPVAKRDKRGQPRKRYAFRTVLDRLDDLQFLLMDKGTEAVDLGFEAKRGVLMGHLAYAEAMYDDTLAPHKKAELASRMVPFFNLSREMVPKADAKFPATEKMLDKEIMANATTIGKLGGAVTPEIAAILSTLAPAAQAPPEEA